jgi:undecaprenyl-diphosphatase
VLLKGARMRSRGLADMPLDRFAAGAGASFASTLLFARLLRVLERDRSPLPYAAYRTGLAGVIVWRLRDTATRRGRWCERRRSSAK